MYDTNAAESRTLVRRNWFGGKQGRGHNEEALEEFMMIVVDY